MEQRRYLIFMVLAMLLTFGWMRFVAPRFVKPPVPPAQEAPADPQVADKGSAPKSDRPAGAGPDQQPARPADEPPQAGPVAKHPHRTVTLGSSDPASGYFLEAELTTRGADVVAVRLNDPRYRELSDRTQGLTVVGAGAGSPRTFHLAVHQFDGQLRDQKIDPALWDWEVASTKEDSARPGIVRQVVFRARAPDGTFEIEKTFSLQQVENGQSLAVRDAVPEGYELKCGIGLRRTSSGPPLQLTYDLQGPVGVPLEDAENARKFRDLRTAFRDESGRSKYGTLTAKDAAAKSADGTLAEEKWISTLEYVAVDVQFFAAILLPAVPEDAPRVAVVRPEVARVAVPPERSDVTALLSSAPVVLEPDASASHAYVLFAGPKRQALFEKYGATTILDYGWFGFVAKGMLALLGFLHDTLGAPYWLAIIVMTVLVRGCMFPLSKKQALGAKKMKDLQPRLQELKKKFGDDREKFARAQMQLFSEHNYNPLAGCLPVFLQLPIFIGLYTALGASVDLRMASFLWIDNLASPDALVGNIGFRIPVLGSQFNLLPIITVVLFVVQQKLFMPPPTDEQSAMQQKMITYMTVFMGFMFYSVPAGLCVYFIASSLWGLAERKLLDRTTKSPAGAVGTTVIETTAEPVPRAEKAARSAAPDKDAPPPTGAGGLWARLLNAADAAAAGSRPGATRKPAGPDKNDKNRSKPRR